jgi:isopenicillin N synthase-like dioxygenase
MGMTKDTSLGDFAKVPVIDIAPLVGRPGDCSRVAAALGKACRDCGFFYVVGHGVEEDLITRLRELSREFFARPREEKQAIRMERGGRAWRGYFAVGDELTSGKPDQKEGLYFGTELGPEHPAVRSRTPLHGSNLFPEVPGFRETVLEYMDRVTEVGHALMRGMSQSLGLEANYFARHYTGDPLVLFRIFNYPAMTAEAAAGTWGVGEHTDYGLLTILWQDDTGGLQVKSRKQWIDAPPIAGSFICNIGDMLDRLTRGLYRSTPHRVLNKAGRDRLSFPLFFDPNFEAQVQPIELAGHVLEEDRHERWDQSSVHEVQGTYGDYLLGKVSKVFPNLRRDVL